DIDQAVIDPKDRARYVYRHTLMTKTSLLSRRGMWVDALASANQAIALAAMRGDHLLNSMATLAKAELLQRTGDVQAALTTFDAIVPDLVMQPPNLYAEYERILGATLAEAGRSGAAQLHFRRARTMFSFLGSKPGLREV